MTRNLKKRKASLVKVIQALDDADAVFGEDVELDSLDEQIPEELDSEDLAPMNADDELSEDEKDFEVADDEVDGDVMELPEDKDDDTILSDEDEDDEIVFDEDDEIVSDEDEDDTILSDEDDLSFLDEVEEDETTTASEVAPGVEDDMGDEANGGDPSVSKIVPGGKDVDVSTDGEVFPTESEYVARIVSRLDRVANYLEKKGEKRMAYRIDLLSDKLEASIKNRK